MIYIFWKSGILVRNIWLFWGKNCWGNLFHWDDCGSGKNRDCRAKLPLLSQHLLLGKNTDCFFQKHIYATLWTVFPINLSTGHGMMTRSLFQLSRWEREFLFFDLMFRDKNFFLSILGFDTRRRIEIKTISARMFENAIFACFCTDIFKKVCYVCLFSREMFMIFFLFF